MSKIAIPYLTILDNKKAIFFTSLKIPRFIFFFNKKYIKIQWNPLRAIGVFSPR